MLKIYSSSNDKIKYLKKLSFKKFRDQENKFVVENITTIYDALNAGYKPEALFITNDLLDKEDRQIQYLAKKIKSLVIINNQVNKYFSTLSTPAGIAAIYDKPKSKLNYQQNLIYLNGINDPGNLGTILRSALAFNLKNVVIDERSVDLYNPKTIAAAKEAIFKLNTITDKNLNILKQIKEQIPVLATSLEAKQDFKALNQEQHFCLVLGSESRGISQEVLQLSSQLIKIPMSNNIESLNVAVAAGILFHQIYKNDVDKK